MRTLAIASILLTGCFGDDKDTEPIDDTQADTDTDSDSDSDTDTDSDADSDSDTDHTFEPGDPIFEATIGGSGWDGEPGYWFASGGVGYLIANQSSGEVQVNIEVLGDITISGTYDVGDVKYTDSIPQSTYDFYYQGEGGATFTVQGHSADGEHLWGTLEGSVALVDSVGGQADTTLSGVTIESWPKF